MASGLVPSCSRIARQLLNRLEDVDTGEILPAFLKVSIPEDRLEEGQLTSHLLQTQLFDFPVVTKQQKFASDEALEGYLNMTWKSQLEVTGLDGLPQLAQAGNVQLPDLALKLSLRTPPTLHCQTAA